MITAVEPEVNATSRYSIAEAAKILGVHRNSILNYTFTEDMLEAYHTNEFVTVWDMYNSATNLYKANKMDIPALLPQNRAFVDFINKNVIEL